jgi:hypothetical protein
MNIRRRVANQHMWFLVVFGALLWGLLYWTLREDNSHPGAIDPETQEHLDFCVGGVP